VTESGQRQASIGLARLVPICPTGAVPGSLAHREAGDAGLQGAAGRTDTTDVIAETGYGWNGDVALAHQVVGSGPLDLLYLPGVLSNVDVMWESEHYSRFLRRLAGFARLLLMDRRGYGCSERFSPSDVAPLEVLVDDALVVLDATVSQRAAIFAFEEGNFLAELLAAARPDRVSHIILLDPSPTWLRNEEIYWEWSERDWEAQIAGYRSWGELEATRKSVHGMIPSIAGDEREIRWLAKLARATQGPGAMIAETRKFAKTDVRRLLPAIHVPTLVLHRQGDPVHEERSARYVADHIEGARYVEIPGRDLLPWYQGWEALTDEIEEFVTGSRHGPEPNRVLSTVLFTDIVGSTETAAKAGDSAWHHALERHHAVVREELARYSGAEQDTAGDGFYATFDGPARAVHCGQAISRAIGSLGLEIRVGIHTGECEVIDGKASGLAVVIGSRVMSFAGPSDVVVSQTVKDLVVGSGLMFEDRGEHDLKGVPGSWHLYAVAED
jgi:class 3 adenylate cyclase